MDSEAPTWGSLSLETWGIKPDIDLKQRCSAGHRTSSPLPEFATSVIALTVSQRGRSGAPGCQGHKFWPDRGVTRGIWMIFQSPPSYEEDEEVLESRIQLGD